MSISIIEKKTFEKSIVSTGAGNYNLPREDIEALYGPGWPIQPVARPEDNSAPRSIDYPVGINYTLQPRVGYGLMPAQALKSAYNSVTEVSNPVNLILRELVAFNPILRDPKTKKKLDDGHPFDWLVDTPDPIHHIPFRVWMTWYKKSAKMYAAPAFHYHRDGNGNIDALEYVDGSTLFLITNAHGHLPEPNEVDPEIKAYVEKINEAMKFGGRPGNVQVPEIAKSYLRKAEKWYGKGKQLPTTTPAFVQVIKGMPFSFWDKDQMYFMPEPPAQIVDSPYGETYIERSWTWINIIALVAGFHLGYYRTGNVPEGLLEMPKEMFPTMGKLAIAEREFNARQATGTTLQMARLRMVPQGSKYTNTKRPDFPRDLYKQANTEILYAIGVPPSEMGEKPGQGLGGRGFEQGAAHDMTRQIMEAEKSGMETALNSVLLKAGVDNAEVYLDYPQEEIDPQMQAKSLQDDFTFGLKSLNDILTDQGKDVIGDPDDEENIANMHIRTVGNSMYVIEKLKIDESGLVQPTVGQQNQVNGSPANPNDPAQADGKEPQPADPKALADAKRHLEETGGKSLTGKMISIPPVQKELGPGAGYGGYNLEGGGNGKHPEPVDLAEIAKRYKVVGTKVINADTGETVPGGEHDTAEEAEAHARALYANVPDARKLAKVDITDHDGAMVAVFIPDAVAKQLRKIADGLGLPADARQETADQMHVTLAFLPNSPSDDDEDFILTTLEGVSREYDPLKGNIQGYGVFNGKDGEHVLYATLDIPDLPFIRTKICNNLDAHGVKFGKDHGFVPHITLAYFPDDWQLPAGFSVPDIDVEIDGITFANGDKLRTVKFSNYNHPIGKRNLIKVDWAEYFKHCGVCPGDEEYFGAPVSNEVEFQFPSTGHINEVEIVAMTPPGLPSKPALWKPAGGENLSINEKIGGQQYKREEAAWLIDQSLGFHMVPLAYVAESNGEDGAVLWYTEGGQATNPKPAEQYAPEWIERAAVFDYIISNQDRPDKLKNYLTHPDDPSRLVLIDNGYSLPENPELYCESVFCHLMVNKPLSPDTLQAIRMCLKDKATWSDVQELIGPAATEKARTCAQRLLDEKMITAATHAVEKGWTTINGAHIFIDDNKTGIGHDVKQGQQMESRLMQATDSRRKQPGISMNIHSGEEPTTGYALSVHPEASKPVENWRGLSRDERIAAVEDYVTKNNNLLSQEGNHLGLWLDKQTGTMWIDTSTVVQDPGEAESMAVKHNQIAYWDILNKREVRTGGTGEDKMKALNP